MGILSLFLESATPTVGIWTILGSAGGAILVILLIRIATALKVSGGLSVELSVLSTIRYDELRIEAKFFNYSNRDLVFSGFGLFTKNGKKYQLVTPMDNSPIETGKSHGHWDFSTSTLHLGKDDSYFAIFHFLSEHLGPGEYYFGFADNKGKMTYISFRR